MKAKLFNGEIITLEKDCQCKQHDGPHWLHMNDFDKEQNIKLKRNAPLAFHAFINAEYRRLKEKRETMERLNISEIIR